MQGNFEKKVQEKLEDLYLQPSVPVWGKIELQIQPEKRRRVVFWWLLALVLLSGAGLWLLTGTKDRKAGATLQSVPVAIKPSEKKQTITTGKEEPKNSAQSTQKRTADNRAKDVSSQAMSSTNRSTLRAATITPVAQEGSHSLKTLEADKVPNTIQEDRSTKPADIVLSEEKPAPSLSESNRTFDTLSAQKAREEKTERLLPVTDSLKRKVAAAKQNWSGKILLAAGISNFLSSQSVSNSYASPAQSTTPGSTTSRTTQPQNSQKHFSFSIGYAVEKKLSGRLSVSVGLQYAYYSTLQKVGTFNVRDTALRFQDKAFEVSSFYSSVSSGTATLANYTNYTNRLHIAELPLSLQYRPFSGLPISFTGGASYGRLVHSNALTYDAAANIYYVNKENNRRHSLHLFSAVQYTAISMGKRKLSAGPVIQYNVLSLQKIGVTKQHLLFAGLKTNINF
jgi:hypothetical protein